MAQTRFLLWMVYMRLFLFGVLSVLSLQCSAYSKEVVLTKADNDKSVRLEAGDTMRVTLEGNPTTGYAWDIAAIDGAHLKSVSTSYKSSSNRCGAGGVFTFTFSPTLKGSSDLQLVYARSWEKQTPPIETFHVTVLAE